MDFFFVVAGVILFIEAVTYYSDSKTDSTDKAITPKKRLWWFNGSSVKSSDMRVYVDNATGVHYLKAGLFDKLQVRINADGTPYTGE